MSTKLQAGARLVWMPHVCHCVRSIHLNQVHLGTQLIWLHRLYSNQLLGAPPSPCLNLESTVQLQRLSFSARKGSFVLVNEIATEAPFPSTKSFKDSLPPALFASEFRKGNNLTGPGSRLLSQRVRHFSLLLPALVYHLSYLTLCHNTNNVHVPKCHAQISLPEKANGGAVCYSTPTGNTHVCVVNIIFFQL